MFRVLLLVLLVALYGHWTGVTTVEAQSPVPYSYCGSPADLFNISNVTANEWPPARDTTLVVLFDGWVLENVTDGNYEIAVSWDGIGVYDEKGDITKLLLNQSLPLQNGTFVYLTKSVDIPDVTPAGSYVVKITAVDMNGKEFTCFTVSFSLSALAQPVPPALTPPTPLPPVQIPTPTFPEDQPEPASLPHPHPMPGMNMRVPAGVATFERRRNRRG